jgi:predicted nucleic acid-binding protein
VTIVCDASVVVAAFVDETPRRMWAMDLLASETLVAPHLVFAEIAHALRREESAGRVSRDTATFAYEQMRDMTIELHSYEPFADRIWALRANVTPYDAWYIALAEAYDLEVATLDRQLAAAPGVRCGFLLPPL